jgi:aminomethyltransferase
MNIQESLDINDTVRISSRAFEASPYLARYDDPNMIRGVYAGRFFTIITVRIRFKNTGPCGAKR